MNKRSQIVLAFAAGYHLLKIGVAIHRRPVGTAVVVAIIMVFSVIGGASASDVVHAIFSFAVISGLVFIVGLACEGRWAAAFLWSIALVIGVAILRGLISYVVAIAASGYLTDYHWWFARPRGWLPSPALVAFYLLAVAVAIIKGNYSPSRPHNQKPETVSAPYQRSKRSGHIPLPRQAQRWRIGSSRTPIRP